MNGDVLWMTSVFATDVRASALMKQVDAMAKQAAMATPGQPMARSAATSPRPRTRRRAAVAPRSSRAQKTPRQKTVVHVSVPTRRARRPPVLQQRAAAATSSTPRARAGGTVNGPGRSPGGSAGRRGGPGPGA